MHHRTVTESRTMIESVIRCALTLTVIFLPFPFCPLPEADRTEELKAIYEKAFSELLRQLCRLSPERTALLDKVWSEHLDLCRTQLAGVQQTLIHTMKADEQAIKVRTKHVHETSVWACTSIRVREATRV